MRLFRIQYHGYHDDYYPERLKRGIVWQYNGDEFYLTYAAAEANIPPLVKQDIKSNHRYGENARFSIQELDAYDVYRTLLDHGFFGLVKNPIWYREAIWRSNKIGSHHCRPDPDNPKLVRYYDITANREITMKPGKYLQKFYSEAMTPRQVAFLAEYWTTGERPQMKVDLGFASTEEEILAVYSNGPRSCMLGKIGPAAYAAGDLAIAYVRDPDTEKYIGRALCWPDRKIYGRIYPNPDNWRDDGFSSEQEARDLVSTFTNKLRELGYRSIQEVPTGFDGARMRFDYHPSNRQMVRMPYLDNGLALEFGSDREFRLKMSGPIRAASQTGYMMIVESECAFCKVSSISSHDEPDFRRNYHEYQYGLNDNSQNKACSSCLEEHTQLCSFTSQRYPKDAGFIGVYRSFHDTEPTSFGLTEYLQSERSAFWKSAKDGRQYYHYWTTPVHIGGKTYHPEEVFYSPSTGQYYATKIGKKRAETKWEAERPAREAKQLHENRLYYLKDGMQDQYPQAGPLSRADIEIVAAYRGITAAKVVARQLPPTSYNASEFPELFAAQTA